MGHLPRPSAPQNFRWLASQLGIWASTQIYLQSEHKGVCERLLLWIHIQNWGYYYGTHYLQQIYAVKLFFFDIRLTRLNVKLNCCQWISWQAFFKTLRRKYCPNNWKVKQISFRVLSVEMSKTQSFGYSLTFIIGLSPYFE